MSHAGISNDWAGLLQNNLILSTLNTRYSVIPQQEVQKYLLKETKAAVEGPKSRNIRLGRWDLINSTQIGEEEFTLAAPEKNAVSTIHQRLSLPPDTFYLLSLEARCQAEKCTDRVSFDLYGVDYDSAEQELYADPQDLSQTYRTFYKINTGSSIPPPGWNCGFSASLKNS